MVEAARGVPFELANDERLFDIVRLLIAAFGRPCDTIGGTFTSARSVESSIVIFRVMLGVI